MKSGMVFLGMGFELIAMSVGGWYLGQTVDQYMGWKGTASTYLVLLLLIGWFVHLIYLLRRFEQEGDDSSGGGNGRT